MSRIDITSIDLNLLKVFEALYEEGGAGRASIRLGITQSAVSAALARLRVVYADHLFERTGRGLRPTGKSEELRPIIAMALEKCRQSLLLAYPNSEDFTGRTVTVGLSDDYELAIGRSLIELAKTKAPGLRIIFKQTHSMVAGEALMSRVIDVSLTAGVVPSRALGRKVLGTGGYSCLTAVRPGQPVRDLTLDDFLLRDHLLVSSGGYVGVVDEALASLSKTRRVEAATSHFAAVPNLLWGSDSVATLPTHAALALSRTGAVELHPCPVKIPRYSMELGWRVDSTRDPAIQMVADLISDTIADLANSDFILNKIDAST
ncbi:LysR family transcriptional regulator [Pseudomonas putida]|uniref:LysR family transcriptional regulator n=1 Tax=Pseudomonas putida TaxID=303 RepID=UPI0024E077ED|nr:LysR family transcriptional regulator [Pseudomonas putida]HDS0965069.1 LysR family transcriptional regulator [Pseudomonas putida]HDS0991451.1 LysR family transcriptional regulator [Pseudomonas putida]